MTQTNDPPLISSLELIPDAAEKADLDAPNTSGGKLVVAQVPNISISSTTVVADETERLGLDVQEGDLAIQSDNSSSYIFTGGDNIAANWQEVQFDAVGAIDGEDINPRDITPRDITASGDTSLQNMTVAGAINGADTSAAAAGEALTSDGSGGFSFASAGGIQTVASFGDLPAVNPPQIAYVTNDDEYYFSKSVFGGTFDISAGPASLETSISTEDSSPKGIVFNNDGSRLYEVGASTPTIYQSIVTNKFEITSKLFDQSINTQGTNPAGLAWNDDGSRLYVVDEKQEHFEQYLLSTPFDISTASFDTTRGTTDANPRGMAWNDDGSRLYEIERDAKIYQYTLSTPFEITTASLDTSFNTQDSDATGMAWNNDGSRLYEVGQATDKIYQYTVSTPYEITSASLDTSIDTQDSAPRGITWDNLGSRLYEIGVGTDRIYQYIVASGGWQVFE